MSTPRGRSVRVTTRLYAFIVPLLLCVLLLFGERCIAIYRGIITEHVETEMSLYTDSIATYLDGMLSDISSLSYTIYANTSLRSALHDVHVGRERVSISEAMRIYSDIIDPTFSSVSRPMRYMPRLYLLDPYLPTDSAHVRSIDQFPSDLPLSYMLENGYAAYFWNVSKGSRPYDPTEQQTELLCLTRVIYDVNRTPLAVLNTEVYIRPIKDTLAQLFSGKPQTGFVWRLRDGQEIVSVGTAGTWVAYGSVAINDSALESWYNGDLMERQVNSQRQLLTLSALVTAMVASVLIFIASKLALKRLESVSHKFAAFDGEHFGPPLPGNDEAAVLDQEFTKLLTDFRDAQAQTIRLNSAMHAMESHLLMSKINPHFLYNTLSAIRWSVLLEGNTEAAEAVDNLVAFYRGVLARGRDEVPLAVELQMLERYVRLSVFTYSRSIQLHTAVTPEAERVLILKFLLQPVVENAIMHGSMDGSCRVDITASVQDALYVEVSNGGKAMDEQEMARLNAYNDADLRPDGGPTGDPGEGGYAVYNIIARIRHLYGEGFGLWYSAPQEGGTKARFRLPILANPTVAPPEL